MEIEFFFPGFYGDLALWHQEGAGNLPQRKHLSLFLERYFESITDEIVSGNPHLIFDDQRKLLEKIGIAVVNRYRAWMIAGNVRPLLKKKTIDFKKKQGSKTPEASLVFLGGMINSLIYRIS